MADCQHRRVRGTAVNTVESQVDSVHRGLLIAIDGPAGSGKSTVAKRLAVELQLGLLDTGAMYRALTWFCLREGVDLDDADAVVAATERLQLRMSSDPAAPQVFVGETEVTREIRSHEVTSQVSVVSALLPVREWMVREQRRQMLIARADGTGMVAEGRDITTVVCPEADVRVLLQASPEARLRRRTLEVYGDLLPAHLEEQRQVVAGRDAKDAAVTEFLKPAPGVTLVDSSDLTVDQVVEAIKSLISTVQH